MDINPNNLPLLASLRVMLDERNVTRAAAILGISQPALSAQLARLRDVFGDQLLLPAASGKGMVLTARAVALREPLRKALQALNEVVGSPTTFEPQSSDRTFVIGANDNATAILGSHLIASIRTAGIRDVRIAFRQIDSTRTIEQLESGALDIALLSKRAVPKDFPHQALLDEKFMMAQRRGHPRGTRRPSLREYAHLEHVIVSGDGGGFRGFVDDLLQEKGVERRVGVSVQYYGVVPLILQSTDLVCTLPMRFLSRYSDVLDVVPLPFAPRQFSLHATWHARFQQDPGHAWLREQIAACAVN